MTVISAKKIFTLLKSYTIREGLGRKDDDFPERFYREGSALEEGPFKRDPLSRDKIDQVLDEYYELRGWDKKTGLPTEERLIELGLDDIAKELVELGKLPRKKSIS